MDGISTLLIKCVHFRWLLPGRRLHQITHIAGTWCIEATISDLQYSILVNLWVTSTVGAFKQQLCLL
jgi:hypothetical protein